MKKFLQKLSAGALSLSIAAGAVSLPAYAAPAFSHPTGTTAITVSGHPLTDSEMSNGSYLINLVRGATIFFDVTSTKPVSFCSGTGSCAATGTTWAYNASTHTTRYTITGTGNVGQSCGLYLDSNRIFQAQIIEQPTAQPFTCDTTDPLTRQVGESYTCKVTLNDPHSNATVVAGTGSVLATYAPPGQTDANGNKVYYYTVTARQAGASGVYVIVDGIAYRAFVETVIPAQKLSPIVVSADGTKTYLKGIDVSEHQGTVDWGAVKRSSVDFVMLRAGYGNDTVDATFNYNISECNRLGIPVGIYWFAYAHDADSARTEAQTCLQTIQNYTVQYPVCYDVEYDTNRYLQQNFQISLTKDLATTMVNAFCDTVQNAGYYAMNYANPDYLNNYFDSSLLQKYDLWYANYPYANPPATICDSAASIDNLHLWQCANNGSVRGISGPVDIDASSVDYASLIRSHGLNRLASKGLRSGQSISQYPLLPATKNNRSTSQSTPAPGQMSQPGYGG